MPNQTPRLSVVILTYNSLTHLPGLLQSLAAQTYQPLEVVVVDNASADDTVNWITEQTIIPIKLISNSKNVWFASGNNQGIAECSGDYIFICNDDTQLAPNCLTELAQVLNQQPHVAAVGPKLLKLMDGKPTTVIDSAGLQQFRSGRTINRGEQEADVGQFNQAEVVFGLTGAGVLFRRSALDQVKHSATEYFDHDFVAYKEDIDLAWRLQRAGFTNWYQPTAVMYHARSIQQTGLTGRLQKPAIIRAYSYRNHWWLLIKNLSLGQWLKRAVWLLPYECAKLGYALLRDWPTLAMIPQTLMGIPTMLRKRYVKP